MLTPIQHKNIRSIRQFAIVASEYNAVYVDSMVHAAKAELKRSGVKALQVIRVPGAYEIPLVAAHLAGLAGGKVLDGCPPAAIICLGVILRGETVHAAHIGEAVSRALMEIQLQTGYRSFMKSCFWRTKLRRGCGVWQGSITGERKRLKQPWPWRE